MENKFELNSEEQELLKSLPIDIKSEKFDLPHYYGKTVDEYYKIINIRDRYFDIVDNEPKKLDFDEYYEYLYSQTFPISEYELHKIKPYLFKENEITFRYALYLYEHIMNKLDVIDYEIMESGEHKYRYISHFFEDARDNIDYLTNLVNMTESEFIDYLQEIIKNNFPETDYLIKTYVNNIKDSNVNYHYISEQLMRVIHRVYERCK